ncbi:uncharacterized protein LOC124945914 isoform X2 [Impatiens glandulifera]|uniref:uncharacterized protein LOC124945914 isoform X2 n=1 Tax=Impatiens glandulifera TaxID=253017 RepID=UPI001FB0ED05|nr:uncharacterized protein LOC124945914 isoform X2 [Impatiens glandulifera]
MSFKPLTSEAIAMTEKKMDMSLEDIIKMSKKGPPKAKNQRISNRNQKSSNQTAQDKSLKARHFIESRSSIRQGTLAQRRSNFQGNKFPLATETARKAAITSMPVRGRTYNRSRAVNNNNNTNKPRFGALPVQKNIGNGSFSVKPKAEVNVLGKQKPQTLDSRFANMKEERMKALAEQNNSNSRGRRNGGFEQNSSRRQQQPQQWGGRKGRGGY